MTIKFNIAGHRAIIIALAASIAVHVFWLSVIKVNMAKTAGTPVEFSKVSFLGPILDMGAMELRVEPRQKTFLENRYIGQIAGVGSEADVDLKSRYLRYGQNDENEPLADRGISRLITDTVSASKYEPSYEADY